jgi:hypothetical protein
MVCRVLAQNMSGCVRLGVGDLVLIVYPIPCVWLVTWNHDITENTPEGAESTA